LSVRQSGLDYGWTVVVSVTLILITPLAAAIAADLFGPARIGLIVGCMLTFITIGFGAGAFLDRLTYDGAGHIGLSLWRTRRWERAAIPGLTSG
jgi:hypothetical protein